MDIIKLDFITLLHFVFIQYCLEFCFYVQPQETKYLSLQQFLRTVRLILSFSTASLLSYSDENLLAAIFLYSRGILNFFVRIVPFAFRWRLEKCRFTSSCTASSRTLVPHGPCQQLLSLILAKSVWLAVRFPKARNRTSSQSSEDTHFTGYARFEKVWAR